MPTYKTPNVYIEEISGLPSSVAEIETAIPAFIGHTQKALYQGMDLTYKPTRITSMMEYTERFGEKPPYLIEEIHLDDKNLVTEVVRSQKYYLYDSLQLFFLNGGSTCYIVSVGGYKKEFCNTNNGDEDSVTITLKKLKDGLKTIEKVDEITLILFPDAVNLKEKGLYALQQDALKQCAELKDRFVIMDMYESRPTGEKNNTNHFTWRDGINEFRDKSGINNLKYGAAYTPYLITNIERPVRYYHINQSSKKNCTPLRKGDKTIELKQLAKTKEAIQIVDNLNQTHRDYNYISDQSHDRTRVPESTIETFLKSCKGSPKTLEHGYNILLKKFYEKCKTIEEMQQGEQKQGEQKQTELDKAKKTTLDELINYFLDILKDVISAWYDDKKEPVLGKEILQYVQDQVNALPDILSNTMEKLFPSYKKEVEKILSDIKERENIEREKFSLGEGFNEKSFESNLSAINEMFQELLRCMKNIQDAISIQRRNLEVVLSKTLPEYRNIIAQVEKSLRTIPPSGAVAGIYAAVDNDRGVWKAPANVSLNSVKDLTYAIDNKEQENLNVDVNAGKSINAIRSFPGKGIIVWGARTLMGNDNEWRYISVRRFFITVEKSLKKATCWAVFEPNDAKLWIKLKGMIENYLLDKWRAGALAGANPEQAFFVKIGLGETMSAQDILEGRLIIEIGLAVVRPAEFIILQFMHKMQEA